MSSSWRRQVSIHRLQSGLGVSEVVSLSAVRFESAVYVLHSFKKKSKQGIKTPQSDFELIKRRLKDAEADYAARKQQESKT